MMKSIYEYNREEYIEWLISAKGYTYEDAVKMADFMQIYE